MSVFHFLSYHNAVPIAVSVVLLGAGATFAATNPETIYSETAQVISIDNTYIVNKDLASYSPSTRITNVTEDSENYYVEYVLNTIDLQDYVWKDVSKTQTMKVAKAALGQYRDLGVYVTEQLKENIEQESRRLAETQEIERKNVSQKVVATVYGGLIGKMLDTSTETIPGYTPVVVAPPPQVASAAASTDQPSPAPPSTEQPSMQEPASQGVPGAPTIQILGNNPARVPIGSAYADLGAVITGPTPADAALGIHIFVDGTEVQTPSFDTSKAAEYLIEYRATNSAGTGSAQRTVQIFDPYAAERAAQSAATTSESVSPSASDAVASSTPGTAPADSNAATSTAQ